MTTKPVTLPTTTTALFTLAALIDIAFLSVIGSKDAAPLPVIILLALLGATTLAALIHARHGNRPALTTAVTLRVISALLAVVSFFADAPPWIMTCEGIVIASTVTGLVILHRQHAIAAPA